MKLGDKVIKTKGYKWPGVIVADFENTKGERRLVVESTSEGTEGALHIYNAGQLEAVRETPSGVYAVAHEVPESKRWYITPGKHYEVYNDYMGFFDAILDDGSKSYLSWDECPHLDGGSWQRVESASYHFWGIHDDEVV